MTAQWIKFEELPTTGFKTKLILVKTKDEGLLLGTVKWFGRWRKYCFFPEQQTVYEWQCLRDLAQFCEDHTAAHRLLGKTARFPHLAADHPGHKVLSVTTEAMLVLEGMSGEFAPHLFGKKQGGK